MYLNEQRQIQNPNGKVSSEIQKKDSMYQAERLFEDHIEQLVLDQLILLERQVCPKSKC